MNVRMLRSTKRVQRHLELLEMLLLYPHESMEALRECGLMGKCVHGNNDSLNDKEERKLLRAIKERLD